MGPHVTILPSNTDIPKAAEVVIAGGGIIGVCIAWFLAQKGIAVVLCEKGIIGGEKSSRNWAFCRQQGRNIYEIPLMQESLRIWHNINHDLNVDIGFREVGCCYLARDEAKLSTMETWLKAASNFKLDTKILSTKEIHASIDGLS